MQVIPVIDVREGVAVAAVRGDRSRYRPLESPLAKSADPVAVAQAYQTLFPFAALYLADLDGIEGRGPNLAVQAVLAEAWPGAELWVDDGTAGGPAQDGRMIKNHVVGSESMTSLEHYLAARETAGAAALLSLDFHGKGFVGPPELLDDATLWPDRIIVMTLARVGSGEGPDLARLASIVACGGGRQVYAAGGVRNADDLRAVRDTGAAGVLVATALHNGAITPADLEELAGEAVDAEAARRA
ncbi:MAG: HisA/HisF-related TIM barrel protein [Hyphomicrobium sp.]|uniref:HisA/HisF-related TIM barrel protein n=1 Tax=Hyphomicrobium sp. TaxID=82 RepID=UPI003D105498